MRKTLLLLRPRSHSVCLAYLGWASYLIICLIGFFLHILLVELMSHWFPSQCTKTSLTRVNSAPKEALISNGEVSCAQSQFFPIITSHSSGRLGNRMSEYASIVGLGALMGYTPIVSQGLQKKLFQVFPKIPYYSNHSLSAACLDELLAINPANRIQLNQAMNHSTTSRIGFKGIKLIRNPHITQIYGLVSGLLQAHFAFEPRLLKAVETWLRLRQHELRSQGVINPIWIGLHVRRTDYKRFLSQRSSSLVTLEFFERAIEKMKVILKAHHGQQFDPSQVVLVVASDDPQWCMRHLPKIRREKFVFSDSNHVNGSSDGTEPYSRVSFDLCLMSQCNHSIYDYGTFAFWGAYLAGGWVVTALLENPGGRIVTDVIRSNREANISRWHYVPAHLFPKENSTP